jgi:hypothetical protein
MTSIAKPFIETVARRVLAALGAGGVAGEIIKKRNDEAKEARSTPIARAEAKAGEKEKCNDCPITKGAPFNRIFPKRLPWHDYQALICGLPISGLPSGPGFITEWKYNGVQYDGFDLSQCFLKEAKAGYDRFFDKGGLPKAWWEYNVLDLTDQIVAQDMAATPPPTRLEWFWQEPNSYGYFSTLLSKSAPRVIHHYLPVPL